jgi:hypothetical protein
VRQQTNTDPLGGCESTLIDETIQLREWGTERAYALPSHVDGEFDVGASSRCWLRLEDPRRLVSRRHARLVRHPFGWVLRDDGSKNGLMLDDARRSEIALLPGVEVGIGGLRLVAESPRSIRLRAFLTRLLGFERDRLRHIDHALRSLRDAATTRRPLVLCGEGDLVAIARRLHADMFGADLPFVVGLRRSRARHPPTIDVAANGTLYVWARRELPAIVEQALESDARMRLVLCTRVMDDAFAVTSKPISIPPLHTRPHEIERVVDEYAEEAIAMLGVAPSCFTVEDRTRVLGRAPATLPEIEIATQRLVALRAEDGVVTRAARRLGMTHVTLSRWLYRRRR